MRVASAHFRPTEVNALKGDASRIRKELKWQPDTTFSVSAQSAAARKAVGQEAAAEAAA